MARAILDIPSMPQNCYECPMRRMYRRKWFCQIIMHVALLDQRRPDCPLVEMDVKALLKHTEALQAENEQLKAELSQWSYLGDIATTELIAERLHYIPTLKHALKHENEQLRAQVARVREALTVANNYMPDIGHFCTCGKCKRCGTDINYAGYKYCLKCARVIIDAALSDTTADYHNPADVEALRKAREAIKAAWSDGSANVAMDKASEALAEIEKQIGGVK